MNRRRAATRPYLLTIPLLLAAGCPRTPPPEARPPATQPALDERAADPLSGWKTLGALASVERDRQTVVLHGRRGALRLTLLPDRTLEVIALQTSAEPVEPSYAVIARPEPIAPTIAERDDALTISGGGLAITVYKRPLSLVVRDAEGRLLMRDDVRGHAWETTRSRTWKQLARGQRFFGFGEKSGHLDKRGRALAMYNSDRGRYWSDDDPLYQSIPFFLSIDRDHAFGVLLDNTHRTSFDLGKESPRYYSFGAEGGTLRYYVFAGPEPRDVLERYTKLVGRMELPPSWALGYQQCRYSYYPEARVRKLARTFRRKKIPCDAIYLDIHYMDGYKSFTWDRERFPHFSKMVGDLRRQGFKTLVIIDPGIKKQPGYFVYDQGEAKDVWVEAKSGKPYEGKVWPGRCVFPDFVKARTRLWWGGLYKGLIEAGIAGFWNDMNEPAVFDTPGWTMAPDAIHGEGPNRGPHRRYHNVYGMLMSRATREGIARLRPDKRPFVLTRASFAGGHRYAASWTGDNVANWQNLALSVTMVLNMGLSGQAFAGPDIGGFHGAPSAELYTRWLQAGVWMPLARTHTEIGTPDQEPWSFGREHEAYNRAAIEQRYRFLPYLYTVFHGAAERGYPVARPLLFEFFADRQARRVEDQFLVGAQLMVAPVMLARSRQRWVYFPEKTAWYELHSRRRYTAGRKKVPAPLEATPVFLRAGAIIPTQRVMQYVGEKKPKLLELQVLPGPPRASRVYLDGGDGHGPHRIVRFDSRRSDRELSIRITPSGSYQPPHERYRFIVWDQPGPPASVTLDGKSLSRGRSYRYLRRTRQLEITIAAPDQRTTLKIHRAPSARSGADK